MMEYRNQLRLFNSVADQVQEDLQAQDAFMVCVPYGMTQESKVQLAAWLIQYFAVECLLNARFVKLNEKLLLPANVYYVRWLGERE